MIEHISSGLPTSALPYSPAMRFQDLIFVSGQGPTDERGAIIADSFEGEFHRTMQNLERILEAAGSSLKSVLQVRAYLRDAADWEEYNRLYERYFPAPFPARTTLTGCLPPTLKFEIDCIAAADQPAPGFE